MDDRAVVLLATQRAIRGLASDLAQRYLGQVQAIWGFNTLENWEQDAETTMALVGAVAEVAIAKRVANSVIERVSGDDSHYRASCGRLLVPI